MLLLLTACTLEHEVSRVVVPNTALTIVVVEDEKSLYRYRVYDGGKITADSADGIIFGHRQGLERNELLPIPVVTEAGGLATIIWPSASLELRVSLATGTRRI
jgi:hypothetical protein